MSQSFGWAANMGGTGSDQGNSIVFEVLNNPTESQHENRNITFSMDESLPGGKTLQVSGQGLHFSVLREGFERELFLSLGRKVYDINYDV
jgi:hypothetical protein